MALALFLIFHFIQNIWNKTTLPSLVSIQQAASEQSELFFLDVHLFFASVLGKELLVPVNSRLRLSMLLPKSCTLLFVPSQFLQTELFGQAELVNLAENTLLKAVFQVKNGILKCLFFVCFFPLNENIRMLKVEIFKQKITLFLAATKLWLFYKKIVFFLSFVTIRTMSNGLAPACYFVFSCWIYSSWIAAVRVLAWPPSCSSPFQEPSTCGWGGSCVGSAVSTMYKPCWLQETNPCCSSDGWNHDLGGLGRPGPAGVVGSVLSVMD